MQGRGEDQWYGYQAGTDWLKPFVPRLLRSQSTQQNSLVQSYVNIHTKSAFVEKHMMECAPGAPTLDRKNAGHPKIPDTGH